MKGKRAADDVSVSDLHQSDAELLDRNEKKTKYSTQENAEVIKIASWNVNGIRACFKNEAGIKAFVKKENPDLLCLSEVKCNEQDNPLVMSLEGYSVYWNASKVKKGGYSGTAIYTKIKPVRVLYGLKDLDEKDTDSYEGRLITMEFEDYYVVHAYVPNAGQKLERLKYRTEIWDPTMLKHLLDLRSTGKSVLWTGDLNVAHLDIDIHDPKSNKNKSAGFTDAERENFQKVLDAGFVDVYRHFFPDEKVNCYTYWGYRFNARAKNKGWRLDYFLTDSEFLSRVDRIWIDSQQLGSDHAPLILNIHK